MIINMAMVKPPMTEALIRASAPRTKPYNLYDGGGLYLTVAVSGAKWWRFTYQIGGREKRMGFGSHPRVSLAAARHARDGARIEIHEGIDPGAARRHAKHEHKRASATTFEVVAREWLAVAGTHWGDIHKLGQRRALEVYAFPWIGHRPIAELRPMDLKPLLDRIVTSGKSVTAVRLRRAFSAIFLFASIDERVDRDAAAALKPLMPRLTPQNYAFIVDPKAIARLMHAIDHLSGRFPTLCAMKLLPMVFVRSSQLRTAEWTEIDFEKAEWRIPGSKRKLPIRQKEDAKTPGLLVPLAHQAMAILAELRPLTGKGRYLFPSVATPTRPMSRIALQYALQRLDYDGDTMTLHGFRHMASTLLHEQGWRPDAIELQLDHMGRGVRAVYNKAQHLAERRMMMQAWADYLTKLRAK